MGTLYGKPIPPSTVGMSVPALVRDALVAQGWDYNEALAFSEAVNAELMTVDWLELYDGTTFNRATKKARIRRIGGDR